MRLPDGQEFIDGATYWFTLKDGRFTGESDGRPYFGLRLDVPQSVKALNAKLSENSEYFGGKVCEEIRLAFDYK